MKQVSTLILRIVVLLLGIFALVFVLISLPVALRSENSEYFPHLFVVYLSTIPFFFSLYQVMKLLKFIDQNKPFSDLSVKALKQIKYAALSFSALYAIAMPYVYYRGDVDDAPGPIAFGFAFIFGAIVIATFVAVLQKLVQTGLDLKSENDLTV